MASLYKRHGSHYWWIKYKAPTGKLVRASTKYRITSPADLRSARLLCSRKTTEELEIRSANTKERWECWVDSWWETKYSTSPKTLQRYQLAWRNIFNFLNLRRILIPIHLRYTDCLDYLNWRKKGDRTHGCYEGHHNTALFEVKVLHMIMDEAVRRGFALTNPAGRLGIKKVPPAEKPPFTDEHLAKVFEALTNEPEWMSIAFRTGLYTGCRLRETCLPLDRVDFINHTITLHGKGARDFTVPIRDELFLLLEKLKKRGCQETYSLPLMPSKAWWLFFKRIGLPQYCFHCLRVTFITRGAQAGIGEREMMRLVNHASATIHRVYTRLRASDLRKPLDQIPLPSFPIGLTA